MAAAGVAGVLWSRSWSGGLAPGCAADGGCAAVLGSRWAQVLGVPVTLPALGVYGAMLALTFSETARASRRLLGALAAAVRGAGVWFTGLQAAAVSAWCPWCLTAHGLGAAAALGVLLPRPRAAAAWGLLAAAGLAGTQVAYEPPVPDLTPENFAGFTGLRAENYPRLGPADAETVIAYLYDVNCPVCRFAHGHLTAARERYGDRLVVALMPVPFSDQCNAHMSRTTPTFASSCELTRLLLAVHLADPAAVPTFDAFLFAGGGTEDDPGTPDVASARAEAERLVGGEALTTAEADPAVDAAIGAHAEVFNLLGRSVPRLIIGGRAYPALTSAEGLFALLEGAAGLEPPDDAGAGAGAE